MDFGLSADQREIQRTARELLAARAGAERVRSCAEAKTPDTPLLEELRGLGWLGIAIPERYGGQGLGRVELSVLCEELGRSLACVPFLPSVLASTLIEHAGSEEQRELWLPALASGEKGAAVGVAGEGRAELVVGGGEAGVFVLLEMAAGGAVGRVLSAQEADVTPVEAIDPTRSTADLSFEAGAGEPLDGDVAGGLDRALVAIAAELVGVCGRALAMTLAYVKERKQFGVPVGSYQAVSHRCAQMLLDTERARSACAYAAWAADADPELLPRAAAMAKASASEAAVEVCASAIQAHGGIGFTWEADVHWLYKRALLDAALLGGAKRQRARLAALL
ncbi:MAG TPA: acyl-CoA dehydrogenase family protein [Solirubrobacteraceae bacterium]|nr:acyl-CoA dehydrogenase family protein [Solirubrobacteraceae bacterium]